MSKTTTGTELTALIKRAMRGNTQAFEELVDTFSEDILYNLFIRLDERNKADAEDAAQEVVLALYKSIGRLKSPHAFYAYLSTCVHNMAHKYNRRGSATRTEDLDEYDQNGTLQAPASEQPEDEFERKQATILLASYIEQLPKKQREVLFLFYYRDLSYGEIAERLGISTGTVGSNMSKAKGALKKMLEESNELTYSSGGASAAADNNALTDDSAAKDTARQSIDEGRTQPDERNDALAGFAAAPLIHDALDHTMSQNALHESARSLANYAQTLVTSHPEVVAAGAAVVAPKVLKGIGVAAMTIVVTVGAFFGLQAASTSCSPVTETSTVVVADYEPAAHIVFTGGTVDESTYEDQDTQADVAEHVNPVSASVVLDEGSSGAWRIINGASGEIVREGSTGAADLSGLAQGEYCVVFELARGDGVGFAQVERSFSVQM